MSNTLAAGKARVANLPSIPVMNTCAWHFLLCPGLALLAIPAHAEDAIAIRYLDGHPAINRSSEWLSLRVSRMAPPAFVAPATKQNVEQNVDRLFDQISAALTEYGINKDWQLAIPDAPAIEISVDINGRKLKLTSCHTILEKTGNYLVTERGGEVVEGKDRSAALARQSMAFQRSRLAFEKILRLALERTQARLSP
jgi:hypothetical protein